MIGERRPKGRALDAIVLLAVIIALTLSGKWRYNKVVPRLPQHKPDAFFRLAASG